MDIEAAGSGAGGGLLMAILTWLGVKQRLDKQEQDIQRLADRCVVGETCSTLRKSMDDRLGRMEMKVDDIHHVLTKRRRKQ